MPHRKHRHHHKNRSSCSSSSSSSSSSCSYTPKDHHTKKANGWIEVKLPRQRHYRHREHNDKALGIDYRDVDANYQMILRKKNSNIAPKGLSGRPC